MTEESRLDVHFDRSADRIRLTAEVFTPSELVCRLLSQVPEEVFAPGKLVLDPACGDGQFLFAAKMAKICIFDMSEDDALNDLYGIDLLVENVQLCKRRLGGGNIVVGNALRPDEFVEGQGPEDVQILRKIFETSQLSLFN